MQLWLCSALWDFNYGAQMFHPITGFIFRAAVVTLSSDQVTCQHHESPHQVLVHCTPQLLLPLHCTLSRCSQQHNNIVRNENSPRLSSSPLPVWLCFFFCLLPFFPPVCVLVTISSAVRLHDSISEEGFHYLVFDLWVTVLLSHTAFVNFGSGVLSYTALSWNLCIYLSSALASKHPVVQVWAPEPHNHGIINSTF